LPIGFVMIRTASGKREKVLDILRQFRLYPRFTMSQGTVITSVTPVFGWPDFIMILRANNLELMKSTIVNLRILLESRGHKIQTSTIVGTSEEEIEYRQIEQDLGIPFVDLEKYKEMSKDARLDPFLKFCAMGQFFLDEAKERLKNHGFQPDDIRIALPAKDELRKKNKKNKGTEDLVAELERLSLSHSKLLPNAKQLRTR